MENQFVPYGLVVKLIKELGFKDPVIAWYNGSKELVYENEYAYRNYLDAPLWQQAFDWFRENHNLYIIIIPTINMYWTFKTMTVIEGMVEVPPYDHVDANDYSTYEEVREACLEKLIEIVENKNKRNGIHNTTTNGFGI